MSRALTAALAAAFKAKTVFPVAFFEGEYASGTLRLWSGVGDYEWDGKTWLGAGELLGVAPIEETSDVRAVGFAVSLSGELSSILSINLGQARQGLPGRVWIGAMEPDIVDYDFTQASLVPQVGAGVSSLTVTRAGATATRTKLVPKYLSLPGASGSFASTPDSAAISITGDIDLRAKAALNSWSAPASNQRFLLHDGGAPNRSWIFQLQTDGKLSLIASADGTTLVGTASSVTVPAGSGVVAGGTLWVRATRKASDGNTRYYWSNDGSTWTQLGTDVAGLVGQALDSSAALGVGANSTAGKLYSAEVRNGIDGPVVARFDAEDGMPASTSFASSATGEVWTLNGAARIVGAEIETVAANTPRFDYDPVTLQCNGPLIEETRTNLCLQSNAFTTSPWSGTASAAQNAVGPDGGISAWTLTDSDAGTFQSRSQAFTVANDSLTHVCSIRVKKTVGAPNTFAVNFNLTGGTLVATNARLNTNSGNVSGGGSPSTVDRGDFWEFRCSVTNNSSGNTTLTLSIFPASGTNSGSNPGADDATVTGSAVVYGAQVEKASLTTSYIPTTSASVTRNADGYVDSHISDWFNPAEGTLVAEFSVLSLAGSNKRPAAFDNGGSAERILLQVQGSNGRANFHVEDDGVAQASITATDGVTAAGAVSRVAACYKQDDFAVVSNGGTVFTDTAGTLPTVDRLHLGQQVGLYLNGHLRRFTYIPRRLSNADLQQLSANGVEGYQFGQFRLIADPFLAFAGRFDVPDILEAGERATITAKYESRLIDLDRVRARRYTSEDQQLDYPGDKGFDYVPSLQDAVITWGVGVR